MLELRPVPEGAAVPWRLGHGVLVVDDTPGVRDVVAAAMRHHGFVVWLAADGAEAVELYQEYQVAIDVVLLDVRMPAQDGPQTLALLRGLSPDVRCRFMSGDLGEYTEADLRTRGALAVFRKPLCLTEVAGRIRELSETPPDRGGATNGTRTAVADSVLFPQQPRGTSAASPEALAERFVTLVPGGPGGCLRIRLAAPGEEPVLLGLHGNPAITRDELTAVRRVVAAAVRAGRDGRTRLPADWSGEDE